jgi:DNA-binding MarR family transcriptional regulator
MTTAQTHILRAVAAGRDVRLRESWGAIRSSASIDGATVRVDSVRALERNGYVALIRVQKTPTRRAKLTPKGRAAIEAS